MRSPVDPWTATLARSTTYGLGPPLFLCKNKSKFGLISHFYTKSPELVTNYDLAPDLKENQFLVPKFYVLVPRVSRPYNFLTVTSF
jgi:hypothetical protein